MSAESLPRHSTSASRFDFPRALADFLSRAEVYRELQKATADPFGLRGALLDCAWALEPNDPADGSPLPAIVRSGPPRGDLPYRWGCPCGATWNSDRPEKPTGALCGPTCAARLFEIKEGS